MEERIVLSRQNYDQLMKESKLLDKIINNGHAHFYSHKKTKYWEEILVVSKTDGVDTLIEKIKEADESINYWKRKFNEIHKELSVAQRELKLQSRKKCWWF